jgi:outer membrane lipoprotein LolB
MKAFSLSILALLIAACAPPVIRPAEDPEQLWETRRQSLEALQAWSLTGRVAVQIEEQGWNATMHWRQLADAYDMRLIAPLGGGAVQLRGDPAGVVLRTGDGQLHAAADPETLLQEQTGMQIPVSGLRFWVLGRPDPTQPSGQSLDGQGRLQRLRQAGWDIAYLGYRAVGEIELPARINLDNGHLQVRLAINEWEIQ